MSNQLPKQDLLEKIEQLAGEYHQRAYVFVLAALEYCQRKRAVRTHISGEELAFAARDLAREQFGLMARTVLASWGIKSTDDVGNVVFRLIEADLLIRGENDHLEDFVSVFDLGDALEQDYPWLGVVREVHAGYPGSGGGSQT